MTGTRCRNTHRTAGTALALALAIAASSAVSAQAAVNATASPIGSASSGSYLVSVVNEGPKTEGAILIELASSEAATGIVPSGCAYGQPIGGPVIGCPQIEAGATLNVCYNGPAPVKVSQFYAGAPPIALSTSGPVGSCPVAGFAPRSSGSGEGAGSGSGGSQTGTSGSGTATGGGGAPGTGAPGTVASLSLGKVRTSAARGTATLAATVPGPGTLKLSGKKVRGQTVPVKSKGTVLLTVKAKGNAAARLAATGRATVAVSVTFTPTGAKPTTESTTVKLVEQRRARAAAAAPITRTFTLDLRRESFTPTGIVLPAGTSASISASGNGKCGEGSDCPTGASGGAGQTCASRSLGPLPAGQAGPSVPYGSVVARVGSGPVSVVGPSGKVSGPGELQLIYADCAGYYSDNTGSYTVTVTYTLGAVEAPEEEPGRTNAGKAASSFTAVQCTISTVALGSSSCTAQVAGYGSSRLVSPTGPVAFAARSGTVGSACTLVATPGSPGISSCTVSYAPAASLSPGTPPPVGARYSGDANFGPSAGECSFAPRSVLVSPALESGVVSAVGDGTDEGIPVDLTNPNPFPVSADEQLTVSGYPEVANSSAVSAKRRAQTIGRASVKLAPAHGAVTKVRLSRAGAKLLKKHHRLKAVLVIVTKRAGQPSRTARHKLTIKG
jgi:hypothetical protein